MRRRLSLNDHTLITHGHATKTTLTPLFGLKSHSIKHSNLTRLLECLFGRQNLFLRPQIGRDQGSVAAEYSIYSFGNEVRDDRVTFPEL